MASRKIKVLECIRQGQIGGGESHLLSLVENIDRLTFDPIVLSFTDGPMIDRLEAMGVRTKVIHTEKPFDVAKWPVIRRFLKTEQIDLVHAHGTRACSNVLRPARTLGLPVIYTVHGWSFHPDQHPLVRRIRVMGEKYLITRTAVNISVSASNRQTGKEVMRRFEAQVISNGIDLKKFSPDRSAAFRDIRSELGIGKDVLLVLFIARFTAHKQPLLLIRAFQECVRQNPGLRLLLVGDGDQKAEALRMVDEGGLAGSVRFQPFRQDVPEVLAAADIFVLPSLWEGLPIGLLEAMAMGKAVIATHVDGTKEVVQDGVNGLLIPSGDVNGLREAILRLAGDKALRTRLSEGARATIQDNYDAGLMTRRIEDLYRKVIARH